MGTIINAPKIYDCNLCGGEIAWVDLVICWKCEIGYCQYHSGCWNEHVLGAALRGERHMPMATTSISNQALLEQDEEWTNDPFSNVHSVGNA